MDKRELERRSRLLAEHSTYGLDAHGTMLAGVLLSDLIKMIRTQPTQGDVEFVVCKLASAMDDDMVFPEETWTEAADRVEPDYPAVAVALRFAQERHRELDPVLII